MSLDRLVRRLVRTELKRLLAERASDGDEWVSQARSPLGRTLHTALWRAGELPGVKVNRRVLVRRRDLEAYIAAHGVPSPAKAKSETAANDAQSEQDALAAKAGFRRVAP